MQEKVASLVRYLRGLAVRRPVAPPRTLLQPRDAHQCVRLVQAFARSDDTDTLTTRLVSAYHSFPPSEADMRHLSLLQQEWQGTGGMHEFCVVQVYGAATCALSEGGGGGGTRRKRTSRARSA